MEKIRLIVTGGRNFNDFTLFMRAVRSIEIIRGAKIIEIVEGVCPVGTLTFTSPDGTKVYGADGIAEWYANEFQIPLYPMPANWKQWGRSAGPIRNKDMADYAISLPEKVICLAFWDKKSKGTKGMMTIAEEYGIEVVEENY